jgi:hypothetical protein
MHVLRSVTYGMLGACLWMVLALIARSGPVHIVVAQAPSPSAPAPAHADNPVSILDVAPAANHWDVRQLVAMVPLAPGERIIAINDHPIGSRIGCSAAPQDCVEMELSSSGYLAGIELPVPSRSFVDLTIGRAATSRRVLVVVH